MRDIKFRAWHKKDGFMYPQGGKSLGSYFDHGVHPVEAWELMQYTGLKDKNGVEIYEGDVLQASTTSTKMVVKWWSGSAGFNLAWVSDVNNSDGHDIEVIGNIHENPELLEAAK